MPPIDSSPAMLRRKILTAASSLPPFGDPSASRTAADITIRPGGVVQKCRTGPAQLADLHVVIDCCPSDFMCYHPASDRYAVLPRDRLAGDLSDNRRTYYDSVIRSTDCAGQPADEP